MAKPPNTSLKRKHTSDNEEGSDMEWSDEEGGTRVEGIYIPPPATPLAAPNTATRLIITKITNNFFKSYADETIVGPFHKCFNAIVGPNGSGKSNVIDSMLFVFGYRATKIRSKKISVLLHNSDQYRNVLSCTVSVHFCEIIDKPGDDYEVVPGSEFVVSRTANKDNSSYYHLDDKKVPFKEVAQLLRKHGIDLDHNRFLILQGEVEEIAMMKCKGSAEGETGMLEYLEDIIGTTRYKKPLGELNDLMEILGEQRSEKLNRLRLVEKDLTELKPALEEAVEFLKTENIVVQCQNVLYQKNIHDLTSQAEDLEKEKGLVTEKHEKLVTQLKELAAEKSEKDKLLKNEASVYENLQKRKEQNKETFNNAEKKDVQLQADMTQLNNNRKKWKEDLAKERKRLAELERIPEENEKGIAECEGKEKELTAKVKTLEEDKIKVLATLREETQELQEEKEERQIVLTELKTTVNNTKSTFDMAESELKIFLSNEENEQKQLETIRANHAECTENIAKRTEEVAMLKKKIPLTEKSLKNAIEELNTVKQEESQIIRDLGTQRVVLEEKRSTMNASKSRGRVIDSLMQQKRQGNCPGLLGRLGDLGAINQKYDVAVSTACGPLDHIVVDTVDSAQWCIEYLKHNNIGRASFIALDKQEHLRARADTRIQTPENVHRLYDLIQVENEAVKPAFYFGLRDTLVADDLDQATRIAYGEQRFRVVTLKGDLIETSGTMSGGGRSVLRGRMGQSVAIKDVNPKEIEKMEQSLQELENSVRVLRQKQVSLEDQVRTLHPELRQMKIDHEKFSKELDHLYKQQPLLAKELKEQEVKAKGTKADPAKVAKLQATIDKNKASYDKALKAANEVQVQVDKLTAEIKAKQSGKMKGVEKSLSETKKTLEKCKSEITRLRVAIKTSERDKKKCSQKIQTLENDIESAENQLRVMKAEREQIEEDTKKLLECIQEITEQLLNGEDAYASRKDEVAELTKQENKLKSEKVDVDNALKNAKKKSDDCNAEIHQWHAKLKHLKLQDIPNETVEELQQFTPEELEEKNIKAIERDLKTAMENIKTAKPNLNVIQEYRRGEAVFMQRSEELNQVTTRRNQIKAIHDRVKNQRKDEFMIGYNIIKLKLKEMYQMITLGGDADFEIVDSFDPFSEGVQLNVRPPKKSWKNISNLSGGEKTLSSLALVFALHHYKPSPLYVMDEIDAALDFKNVSIVAHYIKERTKNAQFIIISLRENMFQLCDRLVGIYKIFNCTHTIPVDPRKYERQIDAAIRAETAENDENENNFNNLISQNA